MYCSVKISTKGGDYFLQAKIIRSIRNFIQIYLGCLIFSVLCFQFFHLSTKHFFKNDLIYSLSHFHFAGWQHDVTLQKEAFFFTIVPYENKVKISNLKCYCEDKVKILNKIPCVEELLKLYFRKGFSNKEMISLSSHKHCVVMSRRTLKRQCRKLQLDRMKNYKVGILGQICAKYNSMAMD